MNRDKEREIRPKLIKTKIGLFQWIFPSSFFKYLCTVNVFKQKPKLKRGFNNIVLQCETKFCCILVYILSLSNLKFWTSTKPSQALIVRNYSTVREFICHFLLTFGTKVWLFLPGCSKSVQPVRSNGECSWGGTKNQTLWRSGRLLQYRPLPTNSIKETRVLDFTSQTIYKVRTHFLFIQNYLSNPINSFNCYNLDWQKEYILFIFSTKL